MEDSSSVPYCKEQEYISGLWRACSQRGGSKGQIRQGSEATPNTEYCWGALNVNGIFLPLSPEAKS